MHSLTFLCDRLLINQCVEITTSGESMGSHTVLFTNYQLLKLPVVTSRKRLFSAKEKNCSLSVLPVSCFKKALTEVHDLECACVGARTKILLLFYYYWYYYTYRVSSKILQNAHTFIIVNIVMHTVFPRLECALYYIAPSNTRLQMPLDQLN